MTAGGHCGAMWLATAALLGWGCGARDVTPGVEPSLSFPASPDARARVEDLRARFVVPVMSPRGPTPWTGSSAEALIVQRPVLGPSVASGFRLADGDLHPSIPEEARRRVARSATVTLPVHASDPVHVEDDTSHLAVTFALHGASTASVTTAGGIALYTGALAGVDVLHRIHAEGTEDYVVFEQRPEREELAYDVDVSHVAGLRLLSRTLEFLDDTGTPRLRVAPPYVVDANGGRSAGALAIEGCAYDASPRAPWGRAVTPSGAVRCTVRVAWRAATYPAMVDPSWTATGSMMTSRSFFTASLLDSGDVLVVGGDAGGVATATAELYTPMTGTFAVTGSLTAARFIHSAARIAVGPDSGDVLVAGGALAYGWTLTATAELYDPVMGTFRVVGPMSIERVNHGATTLASGEVLVTGGVSTGATLSDAVASAEVFDPSTETFRATASPMAAIRFGHLSALLPTSVGSKVLVAGGANETGVLSSAELYDPSTQTFSGTSALTTPRWFMAASPLESGEILLAGGCGSIFTAGSSVGNCEFAVSSAELYDGTTGKFTPTGSMSKPRWAQWLPAALLSSGQVLVAGGSNDSSIGDAVSSAELFDPMSGKFSSTVPMSIARVGFTATTLTTGDVLVAGGIDGPSGLPLNAAELFDPKGDGGVDAGPDSGARDARADTRDSGKDASAEAKDSGPSHDSGTRTDGGQASSSSNSGCSCRTTPPGGSSSVHFWLLGLGALVAVRCRRRRREDSPAEVRMKAGGCYRAMWLAAVAILGSGCGAHDAAPGVEPTVSLPESPDARARVEELRARFVLPVMSPGAETGATLRSVLGPSVDLGFGLKDGDLHPWIAEEARRGVARTATVTLPVRASDPVRVEDDASHLAVSFVLRGVSTARVTTAGGVVFYRGALFGADVLHRVHTEGTEDFVVFEHRPEKEHLAYDVDVSRVAGLRLVSRTLEFLDDTGTPRLRVAPPYVVDERGGRTEGALALEGCAFDASPRAPWGRAVTAPGALHCTIRVTWHAAAYPALVDPSWTATGSMAIDRGSHTATLLGSGKVLVAGGYDGGGATSSAELYDPTTGTFSPTGSMATARWWHTATLLASGVDSGNVLVAGGTTAIATVGSGYSYTATASAEIYDPTTGTFGPTGSMVTARAVQSAAPLGSGEVLLAGGCTGCFGPSWGALSSAELYNPTTRTFAATGSMATPRILQSALAVLTSGEVLLAGGYDGFAELSSAELYDPTTATFAPTKGLLGTARSCHTTTLLDSGKVLVAGGCGGDFTGQSCSSFLSSAELYDPSAGTFTATGSMTQARALYTATLLGSQEVLLAGGWIDPKGDVTATAELYDPKVGTFTGTPTMTINRFLHSATLLGSGKVLVAGGGSGAATLHTAELFSDTPAGDAGADAAGDSAAGGKDSGTHGKDSGTHAKDSGSVGRDSGPTHDAARDAPSIGGNASSGCGCHTAPKENAPPSALLALCILGLLRMARRARSKCFVGVLASCWPSIGCGSSGVATISDAGSDSRTAVDGPHDVGISDAGFDVGSKEARSDAPGTRDSPLTGLPTETWTWVAFPDAKCRDGSSTGIGVNLNPASTKLLIYLEGGGACVDPTSCSMNRASFGDVDFKGLVGSNAIGSVNAGVFDRTNAQNPVQDWSYVYVSYCTGDVHAGDNVAVVPGVSGTQHFVGYVNVGLYLDRLVPTFGHATQVLLTGISAGGTGAAANYEQVARAFGTLPVTLLDDSGPPIASLSPSPIPQVALWGLDRTVLADCGTHCSNPTSYTLAFLKFIVSSHSKVAFGLADSTQDFEYQKTPGTTFEAALLYTRTQLAPYPNFGEFVFAGTDHTSISSPAFYTRTAGGGADGGADGGTDGGSAVLMTDWVKGLLRGTATNEGP